MRWRVLLASIAVVSVVTGAGALWLHRWLATALPTVPGVSVQAAFVDVRPVSVTITIGAYRLDLVPQPVRTAAFRLRTAYWAGFYDVADRPGLPRVWSLIPSLPS